MNEKKKKSKNSKNNNNQKLRNKTKKQRIEADEVFERGISLPTSKKIGRTFLYTSGNSNTQINKSPNLQKVLNQ